MAEGRSYELFSSIVFPKASIIENRLQHTSSPQIDSLLKSCDELLICEPQKSLFNIIVVGPRYKRIARSRQIGKVVHIQLIDDVVSDFDWKDTEISYIFFLIWELSLFSIDGCGRLTGTAGRVNPTGNKRADKL